jgi:two-component system response regulator TctD
MKKILLVEDDLQLQQLLKSSFEKLYITSQARSLEMAYAELEKSKYDLVLVDRGLPDGDGLELIEYLHDTHYQTKVLALTTKAQLQDRVEGLEQGADEYLSKPFGLAEVKLRIDKLLRIDKKINTTVLTLGTYEFIPTMGVLKINEREVTFRKREAQIFECLLRYKNQVVGRETIIADVWAGEDLYPTETTLDVYIRRIRVLLGSQSSLIKTIRGFGYKLMEPVE